MQIEEPVVLARLPKPLQENTQHKYGPVYGLTAGQKRKRHEVSVAIDGISVNIYEVEYGIIKASYAVPPTASFVCSPGSVRVKTGLHSCSRYTYCATKRNGHQRLECFEEHFESEQSQGITSSSKVVAEVEGDVAHLEILSLPGTTNNSQHLLSVLYSSGTVRLYTPDLHEEENVLQLTELRPTARCHDILAVRWLTFDELRKTTFKHRPDLLASADPNSVFLSGLYRQKTGLDFTAYVGVWSIPLSRTGLISRTFEITAIVTFSLPNTQLWSQEMDLECSFNPKATSLLVTGVRGIATFDFSSYSPRMSWEQPVPDHGLTSVRLNTSFVATSSSTALTIHDLKFNSSRATLDLTRIGKKRKRVEDCATNRGFVRILGYFKDLGKLVTVRRNHLLAFAVSGAPKEATLIDSIGCGVPESRKANKKVTDLEIGVVDDLTGLPSERWTGSHQKMTAAAEMGDAAGFEAVALRAVQDPDSLDRLSDEQIEFLLSKIFRWAENTERNEVHGRQHLQVALPAFTLLSSLIEHGAVVRHTIQHAVLATTHSRDACHVEAGMIPATLIQADPTLVLLKTFLNNTEFLDVEEIAATIGMLIKLVLTAASTDDSADLSNQQILERDPMDVDHDSIVDMKLAQADSEFNAPERASTFKILISTLDKFARFGTTAVTDGIRANLDRTETIALIQILRQQLFEGQHTTSILQGYPSPPPSAHSSHDDRAAESILSLDSTSKLLLGCVDAIGSLGFLAEAGGDNFLARVIPELKTETELATQGVQEASYLRGILRETIRYAESMDKDSFVDSTVSLTEVAAPTMQKPGTIVTLYSEPTFEQGDIETRSGILPLSLHAENTITLTKMRKGGGQVKDRTLREVRDLETRNKGRYSFERLVL